MGFAYLSGRSNASIVRGTRLLLSAAGPTFGSVAVHPHLIGRAERNTGRGGYIACGGGAFNYNEPLPMERLLGEHVESGLAVQEDQEEVRGRLPTVPESLQNGHNT